MWMMMMMMMIDFVKILTPHFLGRIARTTYVDAAYCYRPSSVVYRSVCHTREPAKTAEPIEMLFGLRTWVGPENYALDGRPDPPREGAILRGKGRPIVKYRHIRRSCVQND